MKYLFALLLICITAAPAGAAQRDRLPGPVTGEVLEVVDGDTLRVRLHIWLGQELDTLVRVKGIDAPEIHGKCAAERKKAAAARDALAQLVADGKVELRDIKYEKYAGRVLAETHALTVSETGANTGQDVGKTLLENGLVRPYRDGRRAGWCVSTDKSK